MLIITSYFHQENRQTSRSRGLYWWFSLLGFTVAWLCAITVFDSAIVTEYKANVAIWIVFPIMILLVTETVTNTDRQKMSQDELVETIKRYTSTEVAKKITDDLALACWVLFDLEAEFKAKYGPEIDDCLEHPEIHEKWVKLLEDIKLAKNNFRNHVTNCDLLGLPVNRKLRDHNPNRFVQLPDVK